MNRAVFLDRDGTINRDYGYVYQVEKFDFLEGVIEGLYILQKLGFMLIIITNQSGIARGYYTEEDFLKLQNDVKKKLSERGIVITDVFYCPHLGGNCNCRKPNTGLFYEAQRKYDIDFSKSFAIGDKMRDLQICYREKVHGYLISDDGQISDEEEIESVVSLLDAAQRIARKLGECDNEDERFVNRKNG